MSHAGIKEHAFLSRRRSHCLDWRREWWHPRQPINRPMRVETVNLPAMLVALQVRVGHFQLDLNTRALYHFARRGGVRSQSRGCCSCLSCHCSLRVSIYTVHVDRIVVRGGPAHQHPAPDHVPERRSSLPPRRKCPYRHYRYAADTSTLLAKGATDWSRCAQCTES